MACEPFSKHARCFHQAASTYATSSGPDDTPLGTSTMTESVILRRCLLIAVTLAQNARGYLPGTGSFVAGNLSAAAPYGISPDEFGNVTKGVFSTATFNMTGYSMSACIHESTNKMPQAAQGQRLQLGICPQDWQTRALLTMLDSYLRRIRECRAQRRSWLDTHRVHHHRCLSSQCRQTVKPRRRSDDAVH